ncbi:hypothetical protein MZD04_gp105 [Pseudomonas phage Psa21]|uniref:Virion structural protein n=1 Tax=Pseudomonas phage Psa21 TaxID=2530023 RepID=A0A481W5H3_9CAUD|nr:hypothetical protein MZD04_gp105 [Pseudomonas phage Psa21]QBJ02633.1 hypothetical protein PSA21_105 [Pseudomonas phage Psa21]
MLNVRAYLPATEDFDSLPDTLASDISTDGDNTYLAGIPEELILPLDNSEQGNENDDTIVDNLQEQNEKTEEVKESEEDGTELSADENEESTELEVSKNNENTESDDSLDTTQVEDDPDKEIDEEEEDKIENVQYAIEEYTRLVTNAGAGLSHQAAEFLTVGIARLSKQLNQPIVSVEEFTSGPEAVRVTVSSEQFLSQLQSLKNALSSNTNL